MAHTKSTEQDKYIIAPPIDRRATKKACLKQSAFAYDFLAHKRCQAVVSMKGVLFAGNVSDRSVVPTGIISAVYINV